MNAAEEPAAGPVGTDHEETVLGKCKPFVSINFSGKTLATDEEYKEQPMFREEIGAVVERLLQEGNIEDLATYFAANLAQVNESEVGVEPATYADLMRAVGFERVLFVGETRSPVDWALRAALATRPTLFDKIPLTKAPRWTLNELSLSPKKRKLSWTALWFSKATKTRWRT